MTVALAILFRPPITTRAVKKASAIPDIYEGRQNPNLLLSSRVGLGHIADSEGCQCRKRAKSQANHFCPVAALNTYIDPPRQLPASSFSLKRVAKITSAHFCSHAKERTYPHQKGAPGPPRVNSRGSPCDVARSQGPSKSRS